MSVSTQIENGSHEYFAVREAAVADRAMYREAGHSVSPIVPEGDGWSFNVYDLWTEREGLGLSDPGANKKLHRGEWDSVVDLPAIETAIACDAHYPVLLDGEAVVCNRPVGHDGMHEHRSMFGDVRSFEDQAECWTDVPSKLVIVLTASTTDRPDWADVRGVLESYLPADDRLLVARLSATIKVASRGLVGTIAVSGPRHG